jgi:hypothetical protein
MPAAQLPPKCHRIRVTTKYQPNTTKPHLIQPNTIPIQPQHHPSMLEHQHIQQHITNYHPIQRSNGQYQQTRSTQIPAGTGRAGDAQAQPRSEHVMYIAKLDQATLSLLRAASIVRDVCGQTDASLYTRAANSMQHPRERCVPPSQRNAISSRP